MRRVLLFAAFLLLLGLTTATAASFDVQAEDITSFSQPVDIQVPGTPLSGTLYIRGAETSIPGELAVARPPPNNGVNTRDIAAATETVAQQSDPAKFFSWVLVAPEAGYTVEGNVKVVMYQDGTASAVLTAGLFVCPASVPDGDEDDQSCQGVAEGAGSERVTNGNSFEARTVDLGAVPLTTISFGSELRLKIVNNSTSNWKIRWGWNDTWPSRLDIT